MSRNRNSRRSTSAPPSGGGPARRSLAVLAIAAAGIVAAAVYFAASRSSTSADAGSAPRYTYRVLHVYPHDPSAFTQGLEYRDGFLYEGTGLRGRSSLRKVELETGKVLQQIELDPQYFGEGITVINRHIFQLTWQAQQGFVYGQDDFQLQRKFEYAGEGWGLANDGKHIYMSDGSPRIRVWNEGIYDERHITVMDGLQEVSQLNELEWVRGEIYANVWQTDWVVRVSPADGKVLGWIDLSGLLTQSELANVDVLNGIAYDAAGSRLFVTGKLWPKLFEIRVVSAAAR